MILHGIIKCDCKEEIVMDHDKTTEMFTQQGKHFLWTCANCGQQWIEPLKLVKNVPNDSIGKKVTGKA